MGIGDRGLGFRVQAGCRVQGLGFRVQGSGFRVRCGGTRRGSTTRYDEGFKGVHNCSDPGPLVIARIRRHVPAIAHALDGSERARISYTASRGRSRTPKPRGAAGDSGAGGGPVSAICEVADEQTCLIIWKTYGNACLSCARCHIREARRFSHMQRVATTQLRPVPPRPLPRAPGSSANRSKMSATRWRAAERGDIRAAAAVTRIVTTGANENIPVETVHIGAKEGTDVLPYGPYRPLTESSSY